MFVHGDDVECQLASQIRSVWPTLSDHVALHVVLTRKVASAGSGDAVRTVSLAARSECNVPSELAALNASVGPVAAATGPPLDLAVPAAP